MKTNRIAKRLMTLLIALSLLTIPLTAQSAPAPDTVRVAVARSDNYMEFVTTGGYQIVEQPTGQFIARAGSDERWRVELREGRLYLNGSGKSYGPYSNARTVQAKADTVSVIAGGGYSLDNVSVGGMKARDTAGNMVNLAEQGSFQVLSAGGVSELTVANETDLLSLAANGLSYRYRGDMLFLAEDGILIAVNRLDIEDYLRGVIAAEMPSFWPEEALKAQVVASRTYALQRAAKSQTEAYDLTGDQFSQMYTGYDGEVPATNNAVQETAGMVMLCDGELIQAFFHSSSGGFTENSEDVWSEPLPYIRTKNDPYDFNDKHYNWQVDYSLNQLLDRLKDSADLKSISDINCTYTASGARVREITVTGQDYDNNLQQVQIGNADRVRSVLGLKSALFTMEKIYNQDDKLTGVHLTGSGFGHGLGMSQYGAMGMALQGYDFREILRYYFSEITITGSYAY